MENAADALQMAAAVMIFVLALTISINSFGEVRQTSKIIIDYQDREYDYTYVEQNGSTQRIISAETITPSIYKAYKENYKIVFKDKNGNGIELYRKMDTKDPTQTISICSIDLEKDVLGNDDEKERFIKTLLYGSKYPEEVEKFRKSRIFLNGRNFYDTIKGKQFIESLGVYYQEEVQGQADTPDANRTRKRVITYTEI
ncbi:MAG: hypothetical protein HFJ33_01980 [Clostridia bacterium]|nr:hypothetical protein [Clostridia bacterium]